MIDNNPNKVSDKIYRFKNGIFDIINKRYWMVNIGKGRLTIWIRL
jgi:hypothetical protein